MESPKKRDTSERGTTSKFKTYDRERADRQVERFATLLYEREEILKAIKVTGFYPIYSCSMLGPCGITRSFQFRYYGRDQKTLYKMLTFALTDIKQNFSIIFEMYRPFYDWRH